MQSVANVHTQVLQTCVQAFQESSSGGSGGGLPEKRPGKNIDFVGRAAEVDYDAAVLKASHRGAKLVAKTNGFKDPRLPIRKQTTIC